MNYLKTLSLFAFLNLIFLSYSATIYVNQSASGLDNGASWTDANVELVDALLSAAAGDEIWIATGTYTPDWNTGIHNGDRNLEFNIPANVKIYGGFNGTENLLSERDWSTNLSILSGDLNGDDVVSFPTFTNNTENSARVIFISIASVGVELNGLTIESGFNNISWGAAGLISMAPNTIIKNCTFKHNNGDNSGAVETPANRITFENCLFFENYSANGPGAIFTHDLGVTMTNCTVANNMSQWSTGGLLNFAYLEGSAIVNCIIWGNTGGAATTEENQINENTDANGLPLFENNIIEGFTGTLAWMGSPTNFGGAPIFVNPSVGDFNLSTGSAAYNTGDMSYLTTSLDLDKETRVSNSQVEIGAFEMPVIILGVELLDMYADCNGGNSSLSWATSSESNNDYFTIESSRDASSFQTIAIIEGNGTSASSNYYEWTDNSPTSGTMYYRIFQTDYDGTTQYYQIQSTNCEENILANVYPNPFEDKLTINSQFNGVITLMDISGKTVLEQNIDAGESILSFDTLPAGPYFAQVIFNNGKVQNIKLIKL
ncbi:MAG: hypothetical protein ACJA0U_000595 [Salibacteraceae bacterium]|jgi:hypothetical protein